MRMLIAIAGCCTQQARVKLTLCVHVKPVVAGAWQAVDGYNVGDLIGNRNKHERRDKREQQRLKREKEEAARLREDELHACYGMCQNVLTT